MVVLETSIQLFSLDVFKACKIPPFLTGDGIHTFHLKSDHSDSMSTGFQFQVFRLLRIHLWATQKTLEKYVYQWLIYHPCNIITPNTDFVQSCSSFKGSVIRTAVAQVQQASMWDYVVFRVLKSAECYIHFTWSRTKPSKKWFFQFLLLCFRSVSLKIKRDDHWFLVQNSLW